MKRLIAVFLCVCALLTVFAGCGAKKRGDKLQIIVTVFPAYDWVKNVVGGSDKVDVTLLNDKGVDMHSFQPTMKDITDISSCDVFVYVGGESDKWVEDVLKDRKNKDMLCINLMEALGDKAKQEEAVEGMQAEEEGEDELEYDEHIWLSLKNAAVLTDAIAEKLGEKDGDRKDDYMKNAAAYREKLEALDGEYASAVANARYKTLIFADRFPFRYLMDDYGLEYYAAFSGCSAETEVSTETIAALVKALDDNKLPAVVMTEASDGKIARTLFENSTVKPTDTVVIMNSLQSVTGERAAAGETYLGVMRQNLTALQTALGMGEKGNGTVDM